MRRRAAPRRASPFCPGASIYYDPPTIDEVNPMEVSLDEVSEVIRLVREVCDLWDDPNAWRQHLLHGACRLVDGHVGMMLADYQSAHGFFGNLEVISVVGLPAQMQ